MDLEISWRVSCTVVVGSTFLQTFWIFPSGETKKESLESPLKTFPFHS